MCEPTRPQPLAALLVRRSCAAHVLAICYVCVDRARCALQTSIVLDASQEKKLQINFDVTIHHLPCRFASLDIVDVMGTHLQNVSANILKTRVDSQVRLWAVLLRRHASLATSATHSRAYHCVAHRRPLPWPPPAAATAAANTTSPLLPPPFPSLAAA